VRRGLQPSSGLALPLWLAAAAGVGIAFLLAAGSGLQATGFPLDDAWIHQSYARNLATLGQWALVPGQPSAGSTSPLWSLLLSLGYFLGVPYPGWTYGLGILASGLAGWTAARLCRTMFPTRGWLVWLAGLGCFLEWHMAWAAVSGMETSLFTWLALLAVYLWLVADRQPPASANRWAWVGLVGGLLVLTRPEGLLLVALIGLATGWQLRRTPRRWISAWLVMAVGLALTMLPYLLFHYATGGLPLPNTFYAKQQEYRALLELYPVWQRWLTMLGTPLVGAQVLLVPGFVYGLVRCCSASESLSARRGMVLLGSWFLAHLTLYALRLPVVYQHGRYEMPVIPALILVGVTGTAQLLEQIAQPRLANLVKPATLAAGGLLGLAFLVIGAQAYAADVGFIQGEMVATARWLDEQTPPGSLIAVHDIGAVSYFTRHPLLDLAGLVSPQVIPFMTDPVQLLDYMQTQGAAYAAFFPDWSSAYRQLAADRRLEPVNTTGYPWTLDQGRANLTVYRLKAGSFR